MAVKVSVIVTVYKTEQYVKTCLESLVNQTLDDIEIIVINDGSPDDSKKVINEVTEEHPGRIVVLEQDNKGLGAARNTGLEHAQGEYIGFVDSDDWVDPDMFRLMYNTAKAECSDIVLCDYTGVDVAINKTWVSRGWRGKKIIPESIADFTLYSTDPATACNKLFRRDLFQKTPFLVTYYEDVATIPVIFTYCEKISYIAKPFYFYVQRKGSITSQSHNPKNLEVIKGWKRCLSECNPRYMKEIEFAVYRSVTVFLNFKEENYSEYIAFFKENEDRFKENEYIQIAIQDGTLKDLFGKNAIPKIIHYCWFGRNPKSQKILRCIESWHEHLPGWEIREWNEDNCDIGSSKFAQSAYNEGKWAFVADYFRFKVLYEHGGVYLDTDVFLNRPIDVFLQYSAFFPMECYEWVNGTIVGAVPKCEIISKILNQYEIKEYSDNSGTVCHMITGVLLDEYNYQQTGETQYLNDNIAVFSPNVLMINVDDGKNYCEHLYDTYVSWWAEEAQMRNGKTWKYQVLTRYFDNLHKRNANVHEIPKDSLVQDTRIIINRYGIKRVMWQAIKERVYLYCPRRIIHFIKFLRGKK